MPIVLGVRDLGAYRWTNTAHTPAQHKPWQQGVGIGVPELFIGLPGNVSTFGLHQEIYGSDFINILTEGSHPGTTRSLMVCLIFGMHGCVVQFVVPRLLIACVQCTGSSSRQHRTTTASWYYCRACWTRCTPSCFSKTPSLATPPSSN